MGQAWQMQQPTRQRDPVLVLTWADGPWTLRTASRQPGCLLGMVLLGNQGPGGLGEEVTAELKAAGGKPQRKAGAAVIPPFAMPIPHAS